MSYGKIYGGEDPQFIEGDIFRMIISIPEFANDPAAITNSGQVDKWIIQILQACITPQKRTDIQNIAGIKHRETFQRNYLSRLLDDELLVRTIPNNPKSRMQKYVITQKGTRLLEQKYTVSKN